MAAVNKVLNMVFACEIRGRLRVQRSKSRISGADSEGLSFTARSRGCRGIIVKREIIAAAPLRGCGRAMPTGHGGTCAATSRQHGFARRMRFFFHIARICAGSGSSGRRESNDRAFRFVGWAPLRRVGKGAKCAPGARHGWLSAFAHPTRLTLLSVPLHCGPRAAAGPAALALAEPVATLPSRRARAAARSGIRSAGTRSASRELRSAVQRRRPRSAR
jgi:hypothetical protein